MKVWRGAVRQAGAIEVRTINELIDMVVAFKYAGPAAGNRVAVLGGAGGETVESADLCNEAGLELPLPPEELREQLREKMPHAWDWVGNPVDASILAWGRRSESFEVMEMMAASPAYDVIIANVRGIEHALGRDDGGELFRDTMERAKRLAKESGKAAMFVLGEPESNEEWRWKGAIRVREELAAAGVAVYPDMDRATHTMSRYLRYLARRPQSSWWEAQASRPNASAGSDGASLPSRERSRRGPSSSAKPRSLASALSFPSRVCAMSVVSRTTHAPPGLRSVD